MGETLLGKAALRAEAKKDLRIKTAPQDIEDEIEGLVSSALDDMSMRNIDSARICPDNAELSGMKPLGVRAVKLYVKAHFGVSVNPDEAARCKDCYEALANSMSLTAEYRKGGA